MPLKCIQIPNKISQNLTEFVNGLVPVIIFSQQQSVTKFIKWQELWTTTSVWFLEKKNILPWEQWKIGSRHLSRYELLINSTGLYNLAWISLVVTFFLTTDRKNLFFSFGPSNNKRWFSNSQSPYWSLLPSPILNLGAKKVSLQTVYLKVDHAGMRRGPFITGISLITHSTQQITFISFFIYKIFHSHLWRQNCSQRGCYS